MAPRVEVSGVMEVEVEVEVQFNEVWWAVCMHPPARFWSLEVFSVSRSRSRSRSKSRLGKYSCQRAFPSFSDTEYTFAGYLRRQSIFMKRSASNMVGGFDAILKGVLCALDAFSASTIEKKEVLFLSCTKYTSFSKKSKMSILLWKHKQTKKSKVLRLLGWEHPLFAKRLVCKDCC
ncbi:hypothetical protein M427DRAFT_282122 [Gonapodya prolifera JEL478]|uniref:Uncharacterized protein n=1 Tax=Gonapodya prolifera (strain JEL478) TaxID=1344416 RepID=A0A139AYX4_GONPJ|nr:hypothetical protein M427DRAFT_282122 [Gonapodya prolifera JEL478]|eukprot:KXS21926.1 hypothetical protein M427DRAFT_282122 [Gonapodya prolifera JEL478]